MKAQIRSLIILVLSILPAAGLFATEPIQGSSNTEFGDYSIKRSEKSMLVNKTEIPTYELSYSNLKDNIVIGINEQKRCKDFIIKSPNFEVQYVCTKKGFGVRKIDEEYASVNPSVVNALLDNQQFAYQELITGSKKSEDELLHLIACYFPFLINDEVRQLVQK